MIWPYVRDEQSFELETRYEENTASYLLIWRYPEGLSCTERFTDSAGLRERLIMLEQELAEKGWHFTGSPRILTTGWANAKRSAES